MFRHYATGSGAIAVTLDPGREAYQLDSLRLHFSAAAANENFTVTLDSAKGAEWDAVLLTQSTNGITDYVYQWTREPNFVTGDVLKFACANTNVRTWGLEVIWR